MERNVMTSFRMLCSFECFLRYFQRRSGSRDTMIFVCVVTLQGYAIKVLCDFMFWSPSRYVTTLTKSGGHRHCGSGDI